jgi:hypothetical protein
MNERIRELYEQARLHAKSIDADIDPKGWMDLYHQKFAELIVRECIDTVSDCSVEYCTRPQIVSEIKEHFGVEE